MATTYDYSTRQITRDWHFVKWGTPCRGSGLPCMTGSERCKEKCSYYKGSFQWCVLCSHPEKKDAENAPIGDFYREFEDEAIRHYDD